MNHEKGHCRFCNTALKHSFCDLGMTPLSNAFLPSEELEKGEAFFPLHAYVCEKCFLVQVKDYELPEKIFSDYAYFSSYSSSWLLHCRQYVEQMIPLLHLTPQSQVIEIASNDGYLLQYFQDNQIPVLGIEPAANVALVAEAKGIPTLVRFFNKALAEELKAQGIHADLLLGNNVLAHVPYLNDFIAGLKVLLGPQGVITMEFPHLLRLMESLQFDTIYHEHFSYFSLLTVEKIFKAHGLEIFDVEELKTHGGSLRIYAAHPERVHSERMKRVLEEERKAGLDSLEGYTRFAMRVQKLKADLLAFFLECKEKGKKVVGYGAPAKGNTLLNFCGIRSSLLDFTVDRSPHKQGRFLPGTHIPIRSVEAILEERPDYLFILPWNLKEEIIEQMGEIRSWGGQFVVPIPSLEVIS